MKIVSFFLSHHWSKKNGRFAQIIICEIRDLDLEDLKKNIRESR